MNPITLTTVAEPLIRQALAEDITNEDVSTAAIMPDARPAAVDLIAKADGVLCGLDVFERTFTILGPETRVQRFVADGDNVCAGQTLATVTGDVRVLLSGERVALNYLQRMSGIATYTHRVAALLEGSTTQLVDTRKTTPNMRVFEKEAVRCGGGRNHRYNLSDGVLLKDNHIAASIALRTPTPPSFARLRWSAKRSRRSRRRSPPEPTSSCSTTWTTMPWRQLSRSSMGARRPSAPATSTRTTCRPSPT